MKIDELNVPHDPYVKVYGIIPEKCIVFKSAI